MKKVKKKLLAVLTLLSLAIAFTACGGTTGGAATAKADTTTAAATTEEAKDVSSSVAKESSSAKEVAEEEPEAEEASSSEVSSAETPEPPKPETDSPKSEATPKVEAKESKAEPKAEAAPQPDPAPAAAAPEPVAEETVVEESAPEPVAETPVPEEPALEPVVEEPVIEEQLPVEEPIVEEPVVEEPAPEPVVEEPQTVGPPYYIEVNRGANVVSVYCNPDGNGNWNTLVRQMVCSTGRPGHETPGGTYSIYAHTDGGGPHLMIDGTYGRWCMRFAGGGYMFHSVCYWSPYDSEPIPQEMADLGSSVSAGCIRLAPGDAQWMYNNMPNGTTVYIY